MQVSLLTFNRGVQDKLFELEELFDYDVYECRVIPDVLLHNIRNYYPRIEGEKVVYPPPIVPEGGDFQYEFPAGNGIDNQGPPYAGGPPHWCTPEMLSTGHWDGVCPYVFKGADAGKVSFTCKWISIQSMAFCNQNLSIFLSLTPFKVPSPTHRPCIIGSLLG